ncbi:MAG TPA: hypothetical protein VFW46_22070 [Stellaceae bacterium]|nr:hypothetical protein [Stellaceae bacterium]
MMRTRIAIAAAGILVAGLSVPAFASVTQGWRHNQALVPGEAQEAYGGEVLPPEPNIDPRMAVTPPSHGGKIRIIPPPGKDKGVEPK